MYSVYEITSVLGAEDGATDRRLRLTATFHSVK